MRDIVDRHRREPTYRPITIVQDATLAQVAAVTARRLDFELPDVVVEEVPTRRYPDTMAAHLFGYVGEVNDAQVAEDDNLKSGDIVGQAGIEKVYNALLMGEDGAKRVVVNSVGREIRTLEEDAADRGQAPAADDRLRPAEGRSRTGSRRSRGRAHQRGAAVVLDPNNGDVLAFTSVPAYDPERVRRGHRPRDVGVAATPTSCGRCRIAPSRAAIRRARRSRWPWRWRASRRASSRPTSRCTAPATRTSTGAISRAGTQGRPRHDRPASRDRAVVRRVLLHGRQHGRHRQDQQVGDAARPRRDERHRPAERSAGPRAVDRVEAREDAREVVRGRDHLGRHRPGRGVGDAGLDGRLHGDARQRRHARDAAPAQGGRRRRRDGSRCRRRRRSRRSTSIPRSCRRSATACGWSSTRRRDRRHARGWSGTTSRGKTGHRRRSSRTRGARRRARRPRTCATTAGSCSSRRATTRRSPASSSSSTGSTARTPRARRAPHPRHVLREEGRAAAAAPPPADFQLDFADPFAHLTARPPAEQTEPCSNDGSTTTSTGRCSPPSSRSARWASR